MLKWTELLNSQRRKDKHDKPEGSGTGLGRQEIERDFDRILFAGPTRRLADKTQVFPLEKNDSVRTRLTHSHEVSNFSRSMGTRLAYDHTAIFGDIPADEVKRNIPSLLATIGLVHDLGNPPFGHQGEKAIQDWFKLKQKEIQEAEERNKNADKENKKEKLLNVVHDDFIKFDGNAQTIRLLTKLQVLNDDYGLNLTYASLSALIKYPVLHDSKNLCGFKKHGVFESEKEVVNDVWKETGLKEGVRHPLTYVMEACDDIAYSVVDAEDTIKKGYASFDDLVSYLKSKSDNDKEDESKKILSGVLRKAIDKNSEFRTEKLSSSELNDISMQMFRVYAVSAMINSALESFIKNIKKIMSGDKLGSFSLIEDSTSSTLCKYLKKFDFEYGFKHKDVLKLELEGSNYIKNTMSYFWYALENKESKDSFSIYAYSQISENYRRVYEKTDKSMYDKCQLICDAISGMTDSYLISIHDELKSLSNGVSS